MRILEPSEPIVVQTIPILIYGQPAAWKTSIAQTANEPFTLDFDTGIHRIFNRKRAGQFGAWEEVVAPDAQAAIAACKTIVVDTIGRLLDLATVQVGRSPKNLRTDGQLSQNGWGALKSLVFAWIAKARLAGKDIVFIAHEKEAHGTGGDESVFKPDIVGASYSEIMKLCDVVGYLKIVDGQRILDFNPTDGRPCKNPPAFPRMTVPDLQANPEFLAKLIAESKAAMGRVAVESAKVAAGVAEWGARIMALTANDLEGFDKAIAETIAMPKGSLKISCQKIIKERRIALDIDYDKKSGKCVRKPVAVAELPPVPPQEGAA